MGMGAVAWRSHVTATAPWIPAEGRSDWCHLYASSPFPRQPSRPPTRMCSWQRLVEPPRSGLAAATMARSRLRMSPLASASSFSPAFKHGQEHSSLSSSASKLTDSCTGKPEVGVALGNDCARAARREGCWATARQAAWNELPAGRGAPGQPDQAASATTVTHQLAKRKHAAASAAHSQSQHPATGPGSVPAAGPGCERTLQSKGICKAGDEESDESGSCTSTAQNTGCYAVGLEQCRNCSTPCAGQPTGHRKSWTLQGKPCPAPSPPHPGQSHHWHSPNRSRTGPCAEAKQGRSGVTQ